MALDPFVGPQHPNRSHAMMHFEIFLAESVSLTTLLRGGGDWRWRFCTAEGEALVSSGGYASEAACHVAIDALRKGAAQAEIRTTRQFQGSQRRWLRAK